VGIYKLTDLSIYNNTFYKEQDNHDLLSQSEYDGLLMMIEEEKLARDVYSALYDKWRLKIFNNISSSEQRHMTMVMDLLYKYNIKNPLYDSMSKGEFLTPEVQELYNSLVATGYKSIDDALIVGATIEDMDIYDLNREISITNKKDILKVYEKLLDGSVNHARAFNKQLTKSGVVYSAQYLTQTQLDDLLFGNI
jgi:hypothetical protein